MSTTSNEKSWREVRILHNELRDPVVMMPIQSVTTSLNEALILVETNFNERMGPYGVARKFWDVPSELLYDERGLLIGNAFVLAQVSIAQAVAIFGKLRNYCGSPNDLPDKKDAIMNFKSESSIFSGLSQIVVIETTANYFKHQHEWPNDWDESKARGVQVNTLRNVKSIGMTPNDMTANMDRALSDLGAEYDLRLLSFIVHSWREKLAHQFSIDPKIADSI